MRRRLIVAVSLAACVVLYLLEQIIAVDYASKTAAKIILFAAVPYIIYKVSGKSLLAEELNLKRILKQPYKTEVLLGAASFSGILCLYLLLGGFIDFASIARELGTKAHVDPANFPFVAAYIVFGNSFLEELFFRGFVFFGLYKQGLGKFAYIYSSALFGIYHISILGTWIGPAFLVLAVSGLVVSGAVFDWLDARSGNIVSSWIVHIAADSAVIIVGMNMFNII